MEPPVDLPASIDPSTASRRIAPIGYHRLRLLRFRVALIDFFRRWGIYLAIVVLVFGAGSNAPIAIAAATASGLLWPLQHAATGGPLIVPATILYGLIGTLPVVLTRPLWWPRRWAEAERSLPLASDIVRRSDRAFAALLTLPWQGLLALGWLGIWTHRSTSQGSGPWAATGAWLVSLLVSTLLSSAWMRATRRATAPRSGMATPLFIRTRMSIPVTRGVAPLAASHASTWLRLARGRAMRSATGGICGVVMAGATASAWRWSSLPIEWALAFLSTTALIATSALRSATMRELQPLWRSHRELPIDRRACERMRLLAVMMPVLAGLVVLVLCIVPAPADLRLRVIAGYCVVLAACCTVEAVTDPSMQPGNQAARWILMLTIAIAFGSEVRP